jgi:hypothetical protein
MSVHPGLKWYDRKFIVILILFFFFPVGLYGLWKSKSFSKKGKIFGTTVVSIFFVLFLLAPAPETNNYSKKDTQLPSKQVNDVTSTAMNSKLVDILNRASIHSSDFAKIKIAYDVTLNREDVFDLTKGEVEILLSLIYKHMKDCRSYDRAFITLYSAGVENGFATATLENDRGKMTTSTFMWEGYKCGLKKVLEKKSAFNEKVRWLRYNVSQLAEDFIIAYQTGENLAGFQTKSTALREEWQKIIDELMAPQNGCSFILLSPYSQAKTKAISILQDIEYSPTDVNIDLIQKNLYVMNAYKLL